MSQSFSIRIAGLNVQLHPLYYDFAHTFCKDYLTDDTVKPDIVARSHEEFIQHELSLVPTAQAEVADTVVLYRDIADQLPMFDSILVHGAAIEYDGKAYLFTAPSGTGKSTHIRLWRKVLGEKMQVVNGDKPVLRLTENGVNVCSTPWAGKEGWQRNCIVPLGGICLLRRGETDHIEQCSPLDHFDPLLRQVYCPKNGEALDKTLRILDTVLSRVPFYVLDCTISHHAVEVALAGLTKGESL